MLDSTYQQVNLVSDIPGLNPADADLVNSWGVSASPGTDQAPGGALWVSDNGTDKTTLYTSGTATTLNKSGLVVMITSGAPTGQVFNSDTNTKDFVVRDAGLARAPGNFGRFSGALLVGNFGDGHINAYDPGTGAHLGQLRGPNHRPIAIEGLWSLRFGNGNAARTNELVFSSGPGGETHGLLGTLVLAS